MLAGATVAAALAAYLVDLPEPRNAIAIDRAVYQWGDGQSRDVALPLNASERAFIRRAGQGRYLARFDLPAVPDEPQFVLVPATSQGYTLTLNGEPIFKSDLRTIWAEPSIRSATLIRLPHPLLRAGGNDLQFAFGSFREVLPNYLTRIYVGPETALAGNFRWRVLFGDELKTMSLAAQALLGIGILIAFFYRPKDPLFAWLAALVTLAFVLAIALFVDMQAGSGSLQPYALTLAPAIGLLFVGVALIIVGVPPPRSFAFAPIAITILSGLIFISGVLPNRTLIAANMLLTVLALAAATGIVAWGAFRRGNTEARIMLAPNFLLAWFLTRDLGVVLGFFDGSIMFTSYVRALVLAAVLAVLMRRLAMSLDRLDRANEDLNTKLAEREAELAALHREERLEAARLVREQERQRLTRDLHDGISGHLVSIIAMAERAEGGAKSIEQAAREALDDLRLVIYSLDLGDRELPLALANFRERLFPRLRPMGVELDWSTAELPEVTGVTPGNALVVLRILQEAITNALKHGPARRITIRGGASANAMAAITIENDGQPFAAGAAGFGIDNMRHRARQLGGELQLCDLPHGMKVTLLLPGHLPDCQGTVQG